MSVTFPPNPQVDDQVSDDGRVWQWDGARWLGVSSGGGGGDFLPLSGGNMTGPLTFSATPGFYSVTMPNGFNVSGGQALNSQSGGAFRADIMNGVTFATGGAALVLGTNSTYGGIYKTPPSADPNAASTGMALGFGALTQTWRVWLTDPYLSLQQSDHSLRLGAGTGIYLDHDAVAAMEPVTLQQLQASGGGGNTILNVFSNMPATDPVIDCSGTTRIVVHVYINRATVITLANIPYFASIWLRISVGSPNQAYSVAATGPDGAAVQPYFVWASTMAGGSAVAFPATATQNLAAGTSMVMQGWLSSNGTLYFK